MNENLQKKISLNGSGLGSQVLLEQRHRKNNHYSLFVLPFLFALHKSLSYDNEHHKSERFHAKNLYFCRVQLCPSMLHLHGSYNLSQHKFFYVSFCYLQYNKVNQVYIFLRPFSFVKYQKWLIKKKNQRREKTIDLKRQSKNSSIFKRSK